jgi:alcohol-forming fatty acyl-CoA reductase
LNFAGLPVVIFRPAVVIPTYAEPVVGWIDNVYGPTGIIVGAGTGILRVLRCDEEIHAEIVPVDMCCNSMLACAWDVSQNS